MINLNERKIDFGKGDVGIGVIGNTTDSAQLAFYNQSARPIHILKNPDQNPGFESIEFNEEPFIMSFSNPESIDAVISILLCSFPCFITTNPFSLVQRLCWTSFCAFIAKNAFSSIFSLSGFFINFHVHRTDAQAFVTMNTFTLVTMNT